MPKPSEALVNDDGSARELTDAEREYVDTEFAPFDGARPYHGGCLSVRVGTLDWRSCRVQVVGPYDRIAWAHELQ